MAFSTTLDDVYARTLTRNRLMMAQLNIKSADLLDYFAPVLSEIDHQNILAEPTRIKQTRRLMNILLKYDDKKNTFHLLCHYLEDYDFTAAVIILRNDFDKCYREATTHEFDQILSSNICSDIKCLSDVYEYILKANWNEIIHNLPDAENIVDDLMSDEIITNDDGESIMAKRTSIERLNCMMKILSKSVPKDKVFNGFVNILRRNRFENLKTSLLSDLEKRKQKMQNNLNFLQKMFYYVMDLLSYFY